MLQVFLAIFRFVALGMMIFAIMFAIFFDPYSRAPYAEPAYETRPPYLSTFSLFDFGGLHSLLPVAIFSQIFHHSLPVLSQPVIRKSKV